MFGNVHILIEKRRKEDIMLYSEFKKKDVINIKNCKVLGRVIDFEFDECNGQIRKLIVGDSLHFFSFCKFLDSGSNYHIPYKDICQIGPDIILVSIH